MRITEYAILAGLLIVLVFGGIVLIFGGIGGIFNTIANVIP
jgi:Flp pilus assembly pilin Flp